MPDTESTSRGVGQAVHCKELANILIQFKRFGLILIEIDLQYFFRCEKFKTAKNSIELSHMHNYFCGTTKFEENHHKMEKLTGIIPSAHEVWEFHRTCPSKKVLFKLELGHETKHRKILDPVCSFRRIIGAVQVPR